MARRTTTRERLVTTASELFGRQGYGQTGVSAIMHQAKATSGSFYHFFPAKEDLLLAVVDHLGETLEKEVFQPATEKSDDPIERIFLILGAYREFLLENRLEIGSLMGSLASELCVSHPQVRRRLAGLFTVWAGWIEEYLRQAGERLPSDLDRSALAQFVLSVMEGAVLQARVSESIAPFDASVENLKGYFSRLEGRDLHFESGTEFHDTAPQSRPLAADWKAW